MPEPLEEQHARAEQQLEEALGRPADALHASPLSLHYRARIRLRPDPQGRLGYSPPRSHEIVPIPHCAIARPELNEALERVRESGVDLRALRDLELRSNGRRVVLSARGKGRPPEGLRALGDVAWNGRRLSGDPTLPLSVCGLEHQLSPATFYQVNLEGNELLVGRVLEEVLRLEPTRVLDAYAGAGNLSLPLAQRGLSVTLLEREGSAIRDARQTAARAGLSPEFILQPAERYRAGDAVFDLLILDPPRTGAGPALEAFLLTRPRAVIYVSCNPRQLGRERSLLEQQGYQLRRVELFDFFPHTPHFEALAVFLRRDLAD